MGFYIETEQFIWVAEHPESTAEIVTALKKSAELMNEYNLETKEIAEQQELLYQLTGGTAVALKRATSPTCSNCLRHRATTAYYLPEHGQVAYCGRCLKYSLRRTVDNIVTLAHGDPYKKYIKAREMEKEALTLLREKNRKEQKQP